MSSSVQITFDAENPAALSFFWKEALGYEFMAPPGVEVPPGTDPLPLWDKFLEEHGVPEENWNDGSAIVDPDGTRPRFFFQRVPEAKTLKNRLHVDLHVAVNADGSPLQGTERMEALEAEAERLVSLGARRVERHEPQCAYSWGHIIMADPEGNEFCVD